MRKFAFITGYEDTVCLPERKTVFSAGYDFSAAEETVCPPGKITVIKTGVKAYMPSDEYLALYVRSSIAIKKGLFMANSVGIIDADYVDNADNEGHIMVALYNSTDRSVTIANGERIAQGIFTKYRLTDSDDVSSIRSGGIGSTD